MENLLNKCINDFKKIESTLKLVDEKSFVQILQESAPIIINLEKIFNENPFVLERNVEIVVKMYQYRIEHVLLCINNNRGVYTPLNENEIKTLSQCMHFARRILSIEPMNDFACSIFQNMYIFLYNHNPDQDVDKNLPILKEILSVQPYSFQLHFYLGRLYSVKKDFTNALFHLKLAHHIINNLKKQNDISKAFNAMSLVELGHIYYKQLGVPLRHNALYFYKKAYDINNQNPECCNCIASVYTENRNSEQAEYYYNKGLECADKTYSGSPNNIKSAIYMNMGLLKSMETNFEEAIHLSNKSLIFNPKNALAYQNKLLDMNYISHRVADPMYIPNQHFKLGKLYDKIVENYKESCPEYKIKNNNEKINVGFVSGDFANHPVAYFTNGLFTQYNNDKFKFFCYSVKNINLQESFKNTQYTIIHGQENNEVCKTIQKDQIDILIDLSGHTADNRIDVFALKPAPIQMTYLGYPNTTGLKSIDYRITDKYADCTDSEKYYCEKLLYMPHCFLNYTFIHDLKNLKPIRPRLNNNDIVFGSFNKCNKINYQVLEVWTRILKEIPNAKIVLKTKEFKINSFLENFLNKIRKIQGDENVIDRIIFLPYTDSWLDHFDDYNQMDYALDSFPYSGTTTTCDALMMGVPVITIRDSEKYYHSQNVSSSILKNSGLQKYIVENTDEYVELCKKLAKNVTELDKYKVRKSFQSGHVCNTKEFVNDFENLLFNTYHSHFKK